MQGVTIRIEGTSQYLFIFYYQQMQGRGALKWENNLFLITPSELSK